MALARNRERMHRFVDPFIGELKAAEVHRHADARS
jgi:hypothetical protein